ncbi:MAG: hypothetical protein Q7R81_05190 [Candidatus Peregrinibacteria bacterium]|nr:hypothetical protein [Candidatus Peregrinibacteria bacterium]
MSERILVIGDMHLGKEPLMLDATLDLLEYAVHTQAQLILNGDTVDHMNKHTRRALRTLVSLFNEYTAHTGKNVELLRGSSSTTVTRRATSLGRPEQASTASCAVRLHRGRKPETESHPKMHLPDTDSRY